MKTAIRLAVMAVMIVPFFLVNGAQAYTKTVTRSGGGNVSKTWTWANGESYNFTRTCSNGSCSTTRTNN